MKKNLLEITILILLLLAITEENIPIFNINPFESIKIINHPSACVCLKMSDEIKKDELFFIILDSNESNSSINETLSYNYVDLCPNVSCNDFELKLNKECNLSSEENGFIYQYNFEKKDQKYMMIRYYQFTGNNLEVKYSKENLQLTFIKNLFTAFLVEQN